MTTKEFIKYASERPELCEKMSACASLEEAYNIAKEQGVTDDLAVFTTVMIAAKKEAEALSEDDLNQINAAATTTTLVSIISSLSAGITIECGALAAF